MRIEYSNTADDYIEVRRIIESRKLITRILPWATSVLLLIGVGFGGWLIRFGVSIGWLFVVFFLTTFVAVLFRPRILAQRMMKHNKTSSSATVVEWNDDGITFSQPNVMLRMGWPGITAFIDAQNHFLIEFNKQFYFFPKRFFQEEQILDFRQRLSSKAAV